MMYTDELLNNYRQKYLNVEKALKSKGIFPNRFEPIKTLSLGEELILKVIFSLKVAFLEELTFIFAYCYSKQKFEKVIIDLEEQNYLKSAISKDYGKYVVLTKNALFYFYTNGTQPINTVNITEDTLPSKERLYYYKVINGYIAKSIFEDFTTIVGNKLAAQEPALRKNYQKEQFIKRYLFDSSYKGYSNKQANEFCAMQMETFNTDPLLQEQYQAFLKAFRDNPSKRYVNHSLLQFSYLKDFFNDITNAREMAVLFTQKLFESHIANLTRGNPFVFRNALYEKSGKKEVLKQEMELFYIGELQRIYTLSKRNLGNTKKEGKTKEELKEITDKMELLEKELLILKNKTVILSPAFECMVFDGYTGEEQNIPKYKAEVVTLETLKNLKCFITDIITVKGEKPIIRFSIFQSVKDELSIIGLFQRIERIFQFYRTHLYMFEFELELVVLEQCEVENARNKIKFVKEDFKELGSYGLLLPKITDIKIIATRSHMEERFQVFKTLREKSKAF